MSVEPPFAHLPDEITLTRDELAVVLFALDVVEEADGRPGGRAQGRAGHPPADPKLWPDVGDLLGDGEE